MVEDMNRKQETWMSLLSEFWRHTPLGITLAALKGAVGTRRSRSVTKAQSGPLASDTEAPAQAK
jgi:hypothetical protein